jgi:23S rRNA (adenine2503-C2)-methyltransferase
MDLAAMQALLTAAGFEKYRAKQVHQWVFQKAADALDEMGNLPKPLKAWLVEHTRLGGGELVRAQGPERGTRKVLFRLHDGKFVEAVLMRDEGVGRTSLCISSQVGCAMGCTFCLTGFGGYQRNLTAAEIVGQYLAIRRHLLLPEEQIQHIVFMGMGEPMHNLDAVLPSLALLSDPDGCGVSRRRITVSTSGVVSGIERFGAADAGVGLAVSLNATTDTVRDQIMPVNRKWNIGALLKALREFPLEQRRRITVEYVLLRGVNDAVSDAQRLVKLLQGMRCKVNLIMFNPSPQLPFEPTAPATLELFGKVLSAAEFTVTVRWSKGREIEAACGQLAAHYFEKAATA